MDVRVFVTKGLLVLLLALTTVASAMDVRVFNSSGVQVDSFGGGAVAMLTGTISNADVDALEDIAEFQVDGREQTFVTFTAATAALTAFEVHVKPNEASAYVLWFSIASDYTSPVGMLLGASGNLTTAGTTGTHWLILNTKGVFKVKLRGAGTSTVISGQWGAS